MKIILVFFLIGVLSSAAFGAELTEGEMPNKPSAPEEKESTFEWEGNLRLDNDFNPDPFGVLRENLRTQRFELQGSARLLKELPFQSAKELRFVVRSKMEQNFIINGQSSRNHLKAPDYIKEAYLQFKEVGKLPVNILIGASEISYGQDFRGTLDFQNDAAHAMTDPDNGQIKGLTLILDKNLLGLIDKIEATAFAPDPNIRHSSLNHFDGLAARLSKKISEQVDIQGSFLRKGNAYDPNLLPEAKISAAGVFTADPFTVWGEAIKMTNAKAYPDAKYGATGGIARITGPGKINLEITGINKTLNQYAAGYQLFITRFWTAGSTYRYTKCVGGNDGCVAARGYGQGSSFDIAVRLGFGGDENENPLWLGGH
jgi:hypothetical protein